MHVSVLFVVLGEEADRGMGLHTPGSACGD